MELVVLTPEKEIFQGSITAVKVPGTSGHFEVLKDHAPIVSSLTTGAVLKVVLLIKDNLYFFKAK